MQSYVFFNHFHILLFFIDLYEFCVEVIKTLFLLKNYLKIITDSSWLLSWLIDWYTTNPESQISH